MKANNIAILVCLTLAFLNAGSQTCEAKNNGSSPDAPTVQITDTNAIPAKIFGDHFFVRSAMNGHELRLILDTGASHVIISPSAAEAVGLKKEKDLQFTALGGTGRSSAGAAVANSFDVGGAQGKKIPVIITPFPEVFEADGLLGLAFLNGTIFRLDYEAETVSFAPSTNNLFTPRGTSVPIQIEDHWLTIPADVDGIRVLLMVDTGASESITLEPWFVKKYGLRERYPKRLNVVTGLGVLGPIHGEIARLRSLKIGDYELTNLCVDFETKPKARQTKVAGKIGVGVLSRFTLTFDQAGKHLWFEPNTRYRSDTPRPVVRSGLVCLPEGKKWLVQDLVPGSAADAAGVQLKDAVLEINGTAVSAMSSWKIRDSFAAEPGTTLRLRLQTGAQAPREVTLTLHDCF
jgi:clan AA aspartic protease (TIGR02281 family)